MQQAALLLELLVAGGYDVVYSGGSNATKLISGIFGLYIKTVREHGGYSVYSQENIQGKKTHVLFRWGLHWHISDAIGPAYKAAALANVPDDPSQVNGKWKVLEKEQEKQSFFIQPRVQWNFPVRISEPQAFSTLVHLLSSGCCADLFAEDMWTVSGFEVGLDLLESIRALARDCNGYEPVGFPSRAPFHILMRERIDRMENPSLKLCARAHALLKESILEQVHTFAGPWPRFDERLAGHAEAELEKWYGAALEGVRWKLEREQSWLWTNNKYFFNMVNDMRKVASCSLWLFCSCSRC